MENMKVGFIGAGGIARSHAYALQALKFYYEQVPSVTFESVCSATALKRENFARQFGFRKAETPEQFFRNTTINALFILGPNQVHFEYFKKALNTSGVRFIYLEKPVCSSVHEEEEMGRLLENLPPDIKIQVGFQFLQNASVREALTFWKSGILGKPVHFDMKYYHGDYLQSSYREKRKTRLTPAPDGGAMADLGSHAISLLVAFLGAQFQIIQGMQGGNFADVPDGSDLFSSISLYDPATRTVGNLSASRISSGSGDLVQLEIYAEKGTLRYTSQRPDSYEYYLEGANQWVTRMVGSSYSPLSAFPSGHVPPGWLRSLVHAHYLFFTGEDKPAFVPDLQHGLEVQRLVREAADHFVFFRNKVTAYDKTK